MARSRIVTITGVGGVGKTRLAVQCAAEASTGLHGRQHGCASSPALGDAASVPHAVASLFGVQPEAGRTLDGEPGRAPPGVVNPPGSRQLRAPARCGRARWSRRSSAACARRRRPGDQPRAVERHRELVRPVGALDLVGSVQLFTDRASSVRPDFDVTADNEAAVTELCRRLEGVPLAVELAAARVTSMSPAEIEQRLGERFRLLTGGRRTALERQRTLAGDGRLVVRSLGCPGAASVLEAGGVLRGVHPGVGGGDRGRLHRCP